MRAKKIIVTAIMIVTLMTMTVMTAFAESETDITVRLPENQVWKTATTLKRSGAYSNVKAKCDSVYPISGTDHFTKVQVRITNEFGRLIMNTEYTTLTEGKDYTSIAIKQGYLKTEKVRFQFRGNNSKEAKATVCCNAR